MLLLLLLPLVVVAVADEPRKAAHVSKLESPGRTDSLAEANLSAEGRANAIAHAGRDEKSKARRKHRMEDGDDQ